MEHDPQQDAPLARGSLAGSEEQLVRRAGAPGGSNQRALKVAGLTTLACLLLASQVFMAYTMFGQTQKIHKLQKNSESLQLQMKRPAQGRFPMKMSLPSVPLLMKLADDAGDTPKKEEQHKQEVDVEAQLRDFLQGNGPARINGSFLDNLQSMKMKMNESEWKSLESWMNNWLIFQMALHQSAPPTAQPGRIQTKCQLESAATGRKFGAYTPQCDEQGRYNPMQCWHATGFCWCVDESGAPIQGTEMRGRPHCQGGGAYNARRRAVMAPRLINKIKMDD